MTLKQYPRLIILCALVAGLGALASHAVLADKEKGSSALATGLPWEDARLLAEVLERVKRDYVEIVDDQVLIEAAIRGMVSDLDPHSTFLGADEYADVQIATQGNYSGVGLEVTNDEGQVRVVSPIDDTPASRAGLKAGDVIVSVNNESVAESNADETVAKMRGKAGTTVSLEVRREGTEEPIGFELTRAQIEVTSVRSTLLENDFGYVRISIFSETTSRDLYRALRSMKRDNEGDLDGLVLDLRNNPGGVLEAAVEVSDAFLENGLIVSADGRIQDSKFKLFAQTGDLLRGKPVVVLVNGGSA
ncbi:MAG: S41 family peptidase, partial [Pseudomonadota bacterium]